MINDWMHLWACVLSSPVVSVVLKIVVKSVSCTVAAENSLIILTKCCKKIESRTLLIRWTILFTWWSGIFKTDENRASAITLSATLKLSLRRPRAKRSVKCVTSVFSFSFTKISREDFKFIHSSRCFQNASFSATDSPGVLWMEGLAQLTFSLP